MVAMQSGDAAEAMTQSIIGAGGAASALVADCGDVGEIQAMMALRSKDKLVERNMKVIKENLVLLDDFFNEYSDLFEWMLPQAGGTGFVKFKGPMTADELAAELLQNEILVFPSYVFDCDDDLKQYFRIGFSRRTMPASLDAFKEFVDERRAQWGFPAN